LQCAEMEFHPYPFVILVYETVGVASESMHVPVRQRDPSWTHGDGHLMQSLRKQCPEIPVVLSAPHTCARVSLYGVVEVRKLQGIPEKENRGVVSYQIPVSSVCVELYREASYVAFGICRTSFSGDCRESYKAVCSFSYLGED